MKKVLTLYLPDGNTLRFKGVTNFMKRSNKYTFQYFGESTNTTNNAEFNCSQFVGHSITADTEEDY